MKYLLPPGRSSRWLAGACDGAVIACGWWLIALSVVTCIEMLGRKLLGFSLQGVDEVGAYTYGLVGAFGFAYTLVTRSHTRVDFLLSRFAPAVRAWLNLGAMLSLTAVALLCVWRAWAVVHESVEMHSTAATPLATPMWAMCSLRPWRCGPVAMRCGSW
jgi:TRAP-type mannitol/chloroaromatic compound transport system permease small subunit